MPSFKPTILEESISHLKIGRSPADKKITTLSQRRIQMIEVHFGAWKPQERIDEIVAKQGFVFRRRLHNLSTCMYM